MSNSQILRLGALVAFLAGLFFCFSRLAFAPVPWPDASAFFLPSLEIFSWPPVWRMHNQAAFVPSYDYANFNLMPALPLLLGFGHQLGVSRLFGPSLSLKIISMIALSLWAWLLWRWVLAALSERLPEKASYLAAAALGAAALWDPTVRWGTLVVRPETWIGLCWVLILSRLWAISQKQANSSKILWQISALLALAAYFHFEAIVLVPAVVVGVFPIQIKKGESRIRKWVSNLLSIGVRTTLFLSPWLLYVLLHRQSFLAQMQTQFLRLAIGNKWITNPYLLFHSFFLEHGSPTGVPKFFNLAKAAFYILIGAATLDFLQEALRFVRFKNSKSSPPSVATIAGATVFWSCCYLWSTKEEVWFITLCHLTIWPWIGAILLKTQSKNLSRFLVGCTAFYAFLSILATGVQSYKIQKDYNWSNYQDWISCMEREIDTHIHRPRVKIWQPYVPDALVELSTRHSNYDLTRALDFVVLEEKAWSFMKTADVLLLSNFFDLPKGESNSRYNGPPRPNDWVMQGQIPFGKWGLERLPAAQPGQWSTRVCHIGPFWASLVLRAN